MEYPIRIKVEGGADARTAADGVRAVNDQVERANKAPTVKAKVEAAKTPRAVAAVSDKSLIELAEDAQRATKALSALQAQRAALQKGSVVNVAQMRELDARIGAARANVSSTQGAVLKKGGAGFDLGAAKKAIADKSKASEKAELVKIDPKYGMSSVDKAKAAKQKETEKGLADTKKETNEKLFKPLMIGAALVGASLVGAMTKLAPLAIGYQGMARLAMVSQVASFNLRRLFQGTKPGPLLDAIQRTGQLLDPRTFTGDQLGQFLRRTSDGVMGALAKAEPYVRLFFKGMLLGALQVENGFMRFRIAVQPALNLIPKSAGQMATWQVAAAGVKGAIALLGVGASIAAYRGVAMALAFARVGIVTGGSFVAGVASGTLAMARMAVSASAALWQFALAPMTFIRAGVAAGGQMAMGVIRGAGAMLQMGRAALAASGPLLPAIAIFLAWYAAAKQAKDLADSWDENSSGQISKRFKESGLFGPERNAVGAMKSNADKRAGAAIGVPAGGEKVAQPAGMRVGTAMADGLIAGLKASEGKAGEAGAKIVLAAEVGAKGAAEIKSPSRKWRREIGMQLGAGASLGIADSADSMSDAAGRAMPGPGKVQAGGGFGRGGGIIISPGAFVFNGVGAEIEMIVRRIVPDALEDFAERQGALA